MLPVHPRDLHVLDEYRRERLRPHQHATSARRSERQPVAATLRALAAAVSGPRPAPPARPGRGPGAQVTRPTPSL